MSARQPMPDSPATLQRVDPITASIIQGALENIAIEMGYKLMRMSYSSIIRESEDFGAALCDAIAASSRSECVGAVGHTALFYRPKAEGGQLSG